MKDRWWVDQKADRSAAKKAGPKAEEMVDRAAVWKVASKVDRAAVRKVALLVDVWVASLAAYSVVLSAERKAVSKRRRGDYF